MGKSTSSCLKIITCGGRRSSGDSEYEDLAETKAASENHRWSFRKKSSGHRVLSDTVISEPLSTICDKETLQATTTNFGSPIHPSIPVKLQVVDKPKETLPLSPDLADSEVTSTQLADTKTESDDNVWESSAVVIQSAIRRYLAQNEHLKLKNVVKLQAVVRGHIVRRQAVGTLRCVQAIIKMQALVRVRYARQTIEKSTHSGNSNSKADKAQSSIQIVVSNGFARQLLESAPKQKPIYIKCEPSRPDSAAWEWLERWMAVTSSDIQEQSSNKVDVPVLLEETHLGASEASSEVPVTDFPISSTSILAVNGSAKPEDDDLIANTISGFEYQHPASNPCEVLSSSDEVDQYNSHIEIQNLETSQLSNAKTEHVMQETSNSLSVEPSLEQDEPSESIPVLTINKSDNESQSPKSTNNDEPFEIEGKRFAFGPRRMTNPAFAAVQSKFEELSSSQSLGRSVRSVDGGTVLKSKSDNVQSKVDPLIKAMDYPLSQKLVDAKAQMASSECGTEISVSSALGSPERSETESGETTLEAEAFVKENHGANDGANNAVNVTNLNAEANDSISDLKIVQPQENEDDGSKADLTVVGGTGPSEKQTPKPETSEIMTHLEKPTDQPGYQSSPEGSPRSPTTILEPSGISSTQNSVNAKGSKKGIVNQNQKAQMVEKRSPSTPINESGRRISTEQSAKDPNNAKRRTSFSTTKSDGVDHELRLSSSKSLPSYMQATESARAKAHGSISPKSSPDVHDKDHARKRHSLPITNAKQDLSPRMQRSTSQAQQNAKERRWQR